MASKAMLANDARAFKDYSVSKELTYSDEITIALSSRYRDFAYVDVEERLRYKRRSRSLPAAGNPTTQSVDKVVKNINSEQNNAGGTDSFRQRVENPLKIETRVLYLSILDVFRYFFGVLALMTLFGIVAYLNVGRTDLVVLMTLVFALSAFTSASASRIRSNAMDQN